MSDPVWDKPDPVARQKEQQAAFEDYEARERAMTPWQKVVEAEQQGAQRTGMQIVAYLGIAFVLIASLAGFIRGCS